jgi:hypothetical protein
MDSSSAAASPLALTALRTRIDLRAGLVTGWPRLTTGSAWPGALDQLSPWAATLT